MYFTILLQFCVLTAWNLFLSLLFPVSGFSGHSVLLSPPCAFWGVEVSGQSPLLSAWSFCLLYLPPKSVTSEHDERHLEEGCAPHLVFQGLHLSLLFPGGRQRAGLVWGQIPVPGQVLGRARALRPPAATARRCLPFHGQQRRLPFRAQPRRLPFRAQQTPRPVPWAATPPPVPWAAPPPPPPVPWAATTASRSVGTTTSLPLPARPRLPGCGVSSASRLPLTPWGKEEGGWTKGETRSDMHFK